MKKNGQENDYFEFFRRVAGQHVGVESRLKQVADVVHPLRHLHDLRLARLRPSDGLFQVLDSPLRLLIASQVHNNSPPRPHLHG